MKCFNSFVQSAVKARIEGDRDPISSVVIEKSIFIAYSYQVMERSRYRVTKYLKDEKTHGSNKNKMFKRLGYTNDQMFDFELVSSEIEHKEPIINFMLFILHYAKLRMLGLHYIFFGKYCNITNFEELGMIMESLHLALSEHNLYDCIWPAMKKEWK